MRKVIYRPDHITLSDDVVVLGASDRLPKKIVPEPGEDYILDGGVNAGAPPEPKPGGGEELSPEELFEEDEAPRVRRQANAESEQLREMGRMIIEQATAEAARIIEDGHNRAQTEYAIVMEKARTQAENDRETARRQGHAEALKIHTETVFSCVKGLEDAVCRIESAQAAFITGYQNDLKWMALQIAEKILADTIEADQTRLLPLVMNAVHSVKNAQWLSVELSDQMLNLLSALQQELEAEGLDDSVSVKLAPLPADSCIIETPDRFIDASVSRQIENLKEYFRAELHE